MKATKYMVSITIEVLSMDSLQNMLSKAHENISRETPEGQISFDDGDSIQWITTSQVVMF